MDTLWNVLNEIDDGINWKEEQALIDGHILDSFGIITLVSEIEDNFGVSISAAEMVPENFNSMEAMWNMIQRLQED